MAKAVISFHVVRLLTQEDRHLAAGFKCRLLLSCPFEGRRGENQRGLVADSKCLHLELHLGIADEVPSLREPEETVFMSVAARQVVCQL